MVWLSLVFPKSTGVNSLIDPQLLFHRAENHHKDFNVGQMAVHQHVVLWAFDESAHSSVGAIRTLSQHQGNMAAEAFCGDGRGCH